MKFTFHKYQATGNDFIIVDDRDLQFPLADKEYIAHCCDRRFGIGADGLILIQHSATTDFRMLYFNADGGESSLCGNGARATVAFAAFIGIINSTTEFEAIDGFHAASLLENGEVALRMHDVEEILCTDHYSFLNTGSPHHVCLVEGLSTYPVVEKGRKIRHGAPYFAEGTNVNFVEQKDSSTFAIRTYERGVEDETLSCGTGATAVALAMHKQKHTQAQHIDLEVLGGKLQVSFQVKGNHYSAIYLTGPTKRVFSGTMS
jgi:diaminopimelate epimerase